MAEIDVIRERILYHTAKLSIAAGGIETLGYMLQRRGCDEGLEGITAQDISGLGLVLRGLAYAEEVAVAEIDEVLDRLRLLPGGYRHDS